MTPSQLSSKSCSKKKIFASLSQRGRLTIKGSLRRLFELEMSPNEDIALTRFLDSVQLRLGKNQTRFKDYHQLLREANVSIEIVTYR